nr:MAG: RNA-dependent RNA polymerase [Totiviridae sp.]
MVWHKSWRARCAVLRPAVQRASATLHPRACASEQGQRVHHRAQEEFGKRGRGGSRGRRQAEGLKRRLVEQFINPATGGYRHPESGQTTPPPSWLSHPNLTDCDFTDLTRVRLDDEGREFVYQCASVVYESGTSELFCAIVFSLCARGYDYDPVFLLCVYGGGGLWGKVPPGCLRDLFRCNTTLLPDEWEDVLTLDEITARVKRKHPYKGTAPSSPTNDEIDSLLDDPENDTLAQTLYPPRNEADMGIRNLRMADMLTYCLATNRRARAAEVLRLCQGFDYILTSNVLTAIFCFGDLWWKGLQDAGVFDGDSEHYRTCCKALSDTIKKTKNELSDDDRVCFYECASLFGAMCPPVPGWDPIQETRELASGGQHPHGLLAGDELTPAVILGRIHGLVRYREGKKCDTRPFEEWLASCEWERSGSSSIGRVEYEVEVDEEKRRGHFKARKNLVLDVVPFEDLVTSVRSHDTQDNKALVKSEFGKVRLAVSAPLEVYLQQGYLYGVSGSAYLQWPGNTLEESISEEMRRNELTYTRMARGGFALPYDFARFDHQPTTDEVVAFQTITFDRALVNALPPQRSDIELFERLLEHGFRHATLATPPGICEPHVFPVTGGLMSGLRSTSAVGSGWNSVLGESARDMAGRFRTFSRPMETWQIVRGDDTQVVSDHYLDVLAVKLGYDALGAEANESKFTLRQGRTEFLRVETGDRARAYPCRTIPLLGQRKPWSARSPSADASLTRIDKVFCVLARRLPDPSDLQGFADHVMHRMMSKMKLDFRLIRIPVGLGGLGLRPWDGRHHVAVWNSRLPVPVRVLNQTDFRPAQQQKKYAGIGVAITEGESRALADREVREKMATDDMIELAGTIRRVRRAELAKRKIVASGCSGPPPAAPLRCYSRMVMCASNLDVAEGRYQLLEAEVVACQKQAASLYGSERRSIETITALSNLAAVKRKSLGKMLRHHAPWFYGKLVRVEGLYKLRRSSAVDFLLGNLSVPRSDGMPPCVPRLAGRAGAVFLSEMSGHLKPATHVEALRWFEVGASRFATALLESPYGHKLLHV